MKTIEVTGKTLDEAKMNALLELGASSDQVSFEIIDEGSKGLLGLLKRSVKIRATLEEEEDDLFGTNASKKKEEKTAEAAPAKAPKENKEAKAPAAKTEEKKAPEKKPQEKAAAQEKKNPEKKPEKKDRKESYEASKKAEEEDHLNDEIRTFDAIEAVTVTGEKVMIDDTIEQRLKKANESKKNQAKKTGSEARYSREDKPAYKKEETTPYEPKVYEIPADSEEVMKTVKEFLEDLLKKMGIETTVTCAYSEEGILEATIEGEGMGVIIGKRGATLDSLQYLTTLVVNKGRQDHVRLKLDTEGYRERRQETLEKLAVNLAKKAKRTGHKVVLEPMNPYERRIIHSVLQDDPGVETHSDGEEPYRKVVITPKRRR